MGYVFLLEGSTFQKVISVAVTCKVFFHFQKVIKYAGGLLFSVALDCVIVDNLLNSVSIFFLTTGIILDFTFFLIHLL